MFTPINYNFSVNKSLSDYHMEASSEYPFKSASFDGNVLKLVALVSSGGELLIKTGAKRDNIGFQLKVKNAKGNALSKGNDLISNLYVKTSTVANGIVSIFVNRGETFEFTGYNLIAD